MPGNPLAVGGPRLRRLHGTEDLKQVVRIGKRHLHQVVGESGLGKCGQRRSEGILHLGRSQRDESRSNGETGGKRLPAGVSQRSGCYGPQRLRITREPADRIE